MNSNSFDITSKSNSFANNFDFKEEILKYLKKWYFFVISIALCVIIAYLYVRYTVPQYRASATLSISSEDNINETALSAFKDLGVVNETEDKISKEIQLLKSKTLAESVVKKLNLNVQYFTQGLILETENYPKSLIEFNFLSPDSIINDSYQTFDVLINSKTSFSFIDAEGVVISTHSFGKTVSTGIGDVIVTPSNQFVNRSAGKIVKIIVTPVNWVASMYRNKLAISETIDGTSVLRIALNDPSKEKAKDIINNLIEVYQITKTNHKKEISDKTADFIDQRINLISNDLTTVDDEAAGYKSKFGLTNDLGAQTQRVAQFDSQSQQEINNYKTKLRLIQSMENFVQSQDGMYNTIPGNLGFDEPTIANTVIKYNTLVSQRIRLLKTSSAQNPVVVNIDEQLRELRQLLLNGLNGLKNTINIQLSSLQTQGKYFSGKLYVAPTRQKDLRVIEREQTIKEQLYLYLLQKREEAKITSYITVPNSRIIDKASASGLPVFPNKKSIYLSSLFVGFIVPFLSIYLTGLFNTKVESKSDIERQLSIPILGTIPKANKKKKIVIDEKSREPISEAFRILRTNLDFLLAGVKKSKGKVIFVTSSISGEGKTFISANLAKTLSIYGSKVVYVGTDFRYPKLHEFIDLPNGKKTSGFTNYIMDSKIKPSDVIYKEKSESPLSIMPSGIIPPNPSGLLMQPRVAEMFEYLESNYDYVVVDTAPSTLVTDTLMIAKYADLSIYVVREGYTDKRTLTYPQQYYNEKRLNNMTVILNGTELGITNNYGY